MNERIQREIELIEEYRTTLIATAVAGKIDTRPGALHAPACIAPPVPPPPPIPPPLPTPGESRAAQPAAAMHEEEEKG